MDSINKVLNTLADFYEKRYWGPSIEAKEHAHFRLSTIQRLTGWEPKAFMRELENLREDNGFHVLCGCRHDCKEVLLSMVRRGPMTDDMLAIYSSGKFINFTIRSKIL